MPITPQPILKDIIETKDISALNDVIELTANGVSGAKASVTGTWEGTIKFEQTVDDINWFPIGSFSGTTGVPLSQTGITSNDIIVFVGIAGVSKIRARFDSYVSGIATVTLRASNGVSNVFVNNLISANLKTESQILGRDGAHLVDVILDGGIRKIAAQADVTVNSLRGFDPIADTWFFIGTELDSQGAGGIGDTVRVQIAAGDDLTLFPAVDVTTTLTATEAGDETALANLIVSDLNSNPDFSLNYFARRLDEDAVTVYITSRTPGPRGERPNVNDFMVSSTGTTIVTPSFDNIERRQKNTSLARDPANPTLGVLGISGSVTAGEGDVTGRIIEYALNGGSQSLLVNGSVTPVDFIINASPDRERFFTSLRFEGLGNGIQFTNFLSKNGPLTNGILITIRSNDSEITFPPIKTTEDFAALFSRGPSDFDVYDVSGTDFFRATLTFAAPFQLYKQGTFATDDFIRIRIQDDLTSGLTRFRFLGFGFEREF